MLQVLVQNPSRVTSRRMGANELEQWRSQLNHDLLKNGFLERLGTVQGRFGENELKVKLIQAAWKSLRGEDDPQEAFALVSVKEALRQWPHVRRELESFFLHGPEDCGMVRTRLFDGVAEDCLCDSTGWLAVLGSFVDDFRDLAFAPSDRQADRLRQFWVAAEALHQALSDMRPRFGDDGPRFGDFFSQ